MTLYGIIAICVAVLVVTATLGYIIDIKAEGNR